MASTVGTLVPGDGSWIGATSTEPPPSGREECTDAWRWARQINPGHPPYVQQGEWPRVPLPIIVELWDGDTWVDITADVEDDGIEITRKPAAWSGRGEPASCRFTLRNTGGKYSLRQPSSPLYGKIRRNTPVRVGVTRGETRLVQIEDSSWAETTGVPGAWGDLDIRVDVDLDTWRPGQSHWLGVLAEDAYGLALEPTGQLVLWWTENGSAWRSVRSTEPVPVTTGRLAVRAALDGDNGRGGVTGTFSVGSDLFGLTDLGSPVDVSGTTGFASGTGLLQTVLGGAAAVYGVQVSTGWASAQKLIDARFGAAPATATTYTDLTGHVWTMRNHAAVTATSWRFWGAVAEWPTTWGRTGGPSVRARIQASGETRRLQAGAQALRSPLHRAIVSRPGADLAGYWPLEDGRDTTRPTAMAGYPGRVIGAAAPSWASSSEIPASMPLPEIGTARVYLQPRPRPMTGQAQVRWVMAPPPGDAATPIPDGTVLARIPMTGGLSRVDVQWMTSGSGLRLVGYDQTGGQSWSGGVVQVTAASRISVEIKQVGGDVEAKLVVIPVAPDPGLALATTVTGKTLGTVTAVDINPARVDLGGLVIGHVTIEHAITSVFDTGSALQGWAGERADSRAARICTELGVPVHVVGAGAGCEAVGAQAVDEPMGILEAAVTADSGMLIEPRDGLGMVMRTHDSLIGQRPAVTLVYRDNLIEGEPVDDDKALTNIATVERRGGGSATVTAGGPLAPDLVGAYESSETLDLASDDALIHHAGWSVHVGSHDEARWERVGVDLAHPVFLVDPGMTRRILDADIGDRLDIVGLPSWLPPDDVRLLITGYTEKLEPFSHSITWDCVPARPWVGGTWAASTIFDRATGVVSVVPHSSSDTRWDNGFSALATGVGAGDAELQVTATAGPSWTTDPADFPLVVRVGGEDITVTDIAGDGQGLPQVFTVIRGRNGVSVPHAAGDLVSLAEPGVWTARPGGAAWVPSIPSQAMGSGSGTGGGTGGSTSGGGSGTGGGTGGSGTGTGGGTGGTGTGTYPGDPVQLSETGPRVPLTNIGATRTPTWTGTETVINVGDDWAAKIAAASPGTRFRVKAGTHRRTAYDLNFKDGMVFTGEPGAIVSGAWDVSGGWTQNAITGVWSKSDPAWPAASEGGIGPGKFDDGYQASRLREDLFLNDVGVRRVGAGVNAWDDAYGWTAMPPAGTWSYDSANRKIYLNANPTGTVEVSFSLGAYNRLGSGGQRVQWDNLIVSGYASGNQLGALDSLDAGGAGTYDASFPMLTVANGFDYTGSTPEGVTSSTLGGWLITNCEIKNCHSVGIYAGPGTIVRDTLIHHCGQVGAKAAGRNPTYQRCRIYSNNWTRYDPFVEAGGLKSWNAKNMLIEDCEIVDNRGPGLWTDYVWDGNIVRYVTFSGNYGPGISDEMTEGMEVHHTRFIGNCTNHRALSLADPDYCANYITGQVWNYNGRGMNVHHCVIDTGETGWGGVAVQEQQRGGVSPLGQGTGDGATAGPFAGKRATSAGSSFTDNVIILRDIHAGPVAQWCGIVTQDYGSYADITPLKAAGWVFGTDTDAGVSGSLPYTITFARNAYHLPVGADADNTHELLQSAESVNYAWAPFRWDGEWNWQKFTLPYPYASTNLYYVIGAGRRFGSFNQWKTPRGTPGSGTGGTGWDQDSTVAYDA